MSDCNLIIEKMKSKMEEFKNTYNDGYMHIKFCNNDLSWGYIYYRYNGNGPQDGEWMFKSLNKIICIMDLIIEHPDIYRR